MDLNIVEIPRGVSDGVRLLGGVEIDIHTPIPSFTPVKFTSLKFNGAILSSFKPVKIEMFDGATLQVATSSISSTGSFSNTFKHV